MNDLERRLAALAPDYPFPATPDLAGAAGARLGIAGRQRRVGRLVVALAAVVAAFAAVLAVSPGARGALADWLDFLPGVRVERVDELPSMPLASVDGRLRRAGDAGRGRAAGAVRESSSRSRSASPTSSTATGIRRGPGDHGGLRRRRDARLVLTQWTTEDVLFHKLLGPVTQAELVDVREARGLWISGEHVVFYLAETSRSAPPRGRWPGTSSCGRRATSATGSRPESGASGLSSWRPSSASA